MLTVSYLDMRHKLISSCQGNDLASSSFQTDTKIVSMEIDIGNEEESDDITNISVNYNREFTANVARLYLKLQSKLLVPPSTVQVLVDEMANISTMNIEYICKQVQTHLNALGTSNEIINDTLSFIKSNDLLTQSNLNVFANEYARKQFYKQEFTYIEPRPFLLGVNNCGKERHGQYVPILDTIQALFKFDSVCQQFLNQPAERPGVLSDLMHGSVFISNTLFGYRPHSLKIILYQDAFEIVNPVGSAKRKHKLLGVYMTLGNIYAYNRSAVDQVQLVLLRLESDLKAFGWSQSTDPRPA